MSSDNLESLIARLESAVKKLESKTASSVQNNQNQQESCNLPPLDDFNTLFEEFTQKGKQLDLLELHDITNFSCEAVSAMKEVMKFSEKCKPLGMEEKGLVQKALLAKIKKIDPFINDKKVGFHAKAIMEGLMSVIWVLVDAPEMAIKGCVESSEYHSLKLKKEKVQSHTKWYDTFIIAMKNLANYTKLNFPSGLTWNGKGTENVSSLLEILQAGGPKLEKKMSIDPNKAALFSQINVGANITSNLKKVDPNMKNKPVEDGPRKVSSTKTAKKFVQQETAPKKPPKKFMTGSNWFVEYFENEKMIEFGENEVGMSNSIFIDNCVNLTIMVNNKVKSIFMTKCRKVNLIFNSVVSSVESVNSKSIEIVCMKSAPTIVVDRSESVHICLSQNTDSDVVSSNSNEINVTYQIQDGEYQKDSPIPEQLVTKYDPKLGKFVSKPLDIFL